MFTKKSRCWTSWTSFYLGPLTLNGIHYAEHGRAGTRSCSLCLCLGSFAHSVPCGATPWPGTVRHVVPCVQVPAKGGQGNGPKFQCFSSPSQGVILCWSCLWAVHQGKWIDKTGKLWPSLYWSSCWIQTLSFNLCSDTPQFLLPPATSW